MTDIIIQQNHVGSVVKVSNSVVKYKKDLFIIFVFLQFQPKNSCAQKFTYMIKEVYVMKIWAFSDFFELFILMQTMHTAHILMT